MSKLGRDGATGSTGGSRASGGIEGPSGKNVNPVYKSTPLKVSGLEKLNKINRTASESDISYALRQGKITKQEAAAIDPKNFKILLNPEIVSSKTIILKKTK